MLPRSDLGFDAAARVSQCAPYSIATCNVTGQVGLEALLKHSRVRAARAVAVQEHHLRAPECAAWESKLSKIGWRSSCCPA
eukprot:5337605-Pyramimonas_sp.AAC.1